MDHLQFKANQTAAIYVAKGLDERASEEFELHMMGCKKCVEDVEAWRAIKQNLPRKTQPKLAPAAIRHHAHSAANWRIAASLIVGSLIGAAGGWFGHAVQAPDLDSTQTIVFNVPALTRGADECSTLRLAPDTRFAVLRVPGVPRDRRIVLLDSEKHELPADRYTSRLQPDHSHLVRIEAQSLAGRALQLEAKAPDGFGEPLGCVIGEVPSSY